MIPGRIEINSIKFAWCWKRNLETNPYNFLQQNLKYQNKKDITHKDSTFNFAIFTSYELHANFI